MQKKPIDMKYTAVIFLLFTSSLLMAQKENVAIDEGNKKYTEKDFTGAQKSYNDALQVNPESDAGNFNLGNSLFQQKDYEGAVDQFRKAAENTTDPEVRAQAYHNMGNTLLQQKKYEESINAYKQALRNNPEDVDTKYNLAYAQKMIQQQQQQQNKNQDDKKEDQKKEEQKKDEPQDQNKEQQPPKDQQQEQKQSQPKQYTKEELERIMQALNQDDKNVQEKVNKQKVQAAGAEAEKDW